MPSSTLLYFLCAVVAVNAVRLFPPQLDRLPVGAVKPMGWLLRQAEIQAKGLTGGLATWKPGGPASSKYMPGKTTSSEEQGGEYYINGNFSNICLTVIDQVTSEHRPDVEACSR
jgi:hypothetical protein